jgi:hypothetical protein
MLLSGFGREDGLNIVCKMYGNMWNMKMNGLKVIEEGGGWN